MTSEVAFDNKNDYNASMVWEVHKVSDELMIGSLC